MIIKLGVALFLVMFLMVGAQLYESDQEYNVTRDIYNFTEEKIDIPLSTISLGHPIEKTQGLINVGRIYLITEYGVNFLLVSVEQISKMGVEYGYQNPNINWEKILKFGMFALTVWIVVMLIKPFGYLLVFLMMLVMMIFDKLKKRKLMRNMKGGNLKK